MKKLLALLVVVGLAVGLGCGTKPSATGKVVKPGGAPTAGKPEDKGGGGPVMTEKPGGSTVKPGEGPKPPEEKKPEEKKPEEKKPEEKKPEEKKPEEKKPEEKK